MHLRLHVYKQQYQKEMYAASPRLEATHEKHAQNTNQWRKMAKW